MSRGLTAGMVSQVTAGTLHPVMLLEAQFDSGTLYYWSGGYGDISWNGQTWQGLGEFLAMSPVTETAAVKATGASFTLSGMPSALVAIAQSEPYQGRPFIARFACVAADGTLVADPYEAFVGKMDTITDEDDGKTCTLTLSVENDLIDLEGAADRRYTPEDQALDFPEETGSPHHRDRLFDQVAALQDMQIVLE